MNSGFLLRFQEVVKPITMDKRTAKICMFVEQEKCIRIGIRLNC